MSVGGVPKYSDATLLDAFPYTSFIFIFIYISSSSSSLFFDRNPDESLCFFSGNILLLKVMKWMKDLW